MSLLSLSGQLGAEELFQIFHNVDRGYLEDHVLRGWVNQTRLLSCATRLCRPLPISAEEDQKIYGVSNEFVNRNPRNLEMLGIAHKRRGWRFQAPRKDFYHQLILQRGPRHTSAKLVHSSGRCVASASTEENAISQHLYSTTDVNASFNIGRIIAHRCHQVGIDSMLFEQDNPGEAISKFREAVLDAGISLEEVDESPYADYEIGSSYDEPS